MLRSPPNPPASPRFLTWACKKRGWALFVALLLGPMAAAESAPGNALGSYTVRPGDTAYSVARQAGMGVPTLLRLNGLTTADLKPGQVLRLPIEGGEAAAPPPSSSLPPPRSYTVLAGQTLYAVARLYGLKAAEVQEFNHLSSPDLRPGQVLLLPPVTGPPTSVSPVSVAAPARPAGPEAQLRHAVQPGQTLYSIARMYGLRAADLLTLNHLGGPDLRPGQVLLLPAGTVTQAVGPANSLPAVPAGPAQVSPVQVSPVQVTPTPASPVPGGAQFSPGVPLPAPPVMAPRRSDVAPATADQAAAAVMPDGWRGLALSFLGVPYMYGGTSRSGTDCSGLVVQVFAPLGLNLPRQSALQAQAGVQVELPDLQPGDLLFFDTEGRGSVTHVGIYLGSYLGMDGAFISANSFGGQVAVDRLGEKYFAQRYLWARRVLGPMSAQSH